MLYIIIQSYMDDPNEIELLNKQIANAFDIGEPKKKQEVVVTPIMQKKSNELPWVEKYRPKKLDDIIQQDEIVKILKDTLKTGQLPHLLLFGPPGTGKTSTCLAIAMQLFGPKIIHDRVVELNASDDRGISIVRNKILDFAKFAIGSKDPNYPCPDYKIVILDEADSMTPEAQAALRIVMEEKSGITRFFIICNYKNQILDPIVSRCTPFRFKPLEKKAIIKKLNDIAKKEKLIVNNECFDKIYEISNGDVRRAIMTLQNLKYIQSYKKVVTPMDILNISGGIDISMLEGFWEKCCNENVVTVRKLALLVLREGFSVESVIVYLNDCILNSKFTDQKKSKIALELAETSRRLLEGGDEYLQMLNVLLYINMIVNKGYEIK